jgi:CheY-like chemotaxis protein
MVTQLAQRKAQSLTLEIDEDLAQIWADQRRLKQMLVNLLSNAVKFTPLGGKIGLAVNGDRGDNTISFTVWDTGIGMREEDQTRLFRPFVQLESGLANKTAGTGLGLALVAQMARLHDGHVRVSSAPGAGSRFTITLPWTPSTLPQPPDIEINLPAPPSFSEGELDVAPATRTILLVEDTESTILAVKDFLEYAGYSIAIARNGQEGIEQAKMTLPDLILMDVQMPVMNGLETTQRLRSDPAFKATPIIALTALAMPNDQERCLAAGMDGYLTKPFKLQTLLDAIRVLLASGAGVQHRPGPG